MFLDKLKEEDFYVLRGALESGRQSPNNFGGMLTLGIFLQILMVSITHIVLGYESQLPNKTTIFLIHSILTIAIIILSAIFAIPSVYKKREVSQYLVSIVVSQNIFGITPYFWTLHTIGRTDATIASLIFATILTLILGLLVFIVTCIRFNLLLKQGKYRKGRSKGQTRQKFEAKSFLPHAVIGGLGIFYFIQFFVSHVSRIEINFLMIGIIGMLLFYGMIFVLPEQLVILYCKKRFKSFNFDKEGNIYPMGSGERVG
ncbi:hypothetical protein [Gracilibacillus thailandensis]|uniref:ABC transporter ATPase n=1 Tax=Gracilibacillus thailandensis TaxID=563735 RepID=A0A6N7R5V5_9BACI|nr:hypothetical protein [Gracilibacillus thailandensis]MRI68617.1 hypothetical protein [Gracilibacillus thailandensis]